MFTSLLTLHEILVGHFFLSKKWWPFVYFLVFVLLHLYIFMRDVCGDMKVIVPFFFYCCYIVVV